MQPLCSLGLHLILIPRQGTLIPIDAHEILVSTTVNTVEKQHLRCSAVHASEDHIHILIGMTHESDIPDLITALLSDLRRELRRQGAHLSTFEWDDAVHVTLLPPWHLEIMASFVRDQDRFHQTRTLEEELDEVFRPNSIADQHSEQPRRRGAASALHIN